MRFRKSLWNRLFQMASKKHGYETDILKEAEDGSYFAELKNKEISFSVHPITPKSKKRLETIIKNREEETEESSIKFSNLPTEELEAYREGKPTHTLQYELSFWSDLAKWLMNLQEEGVDYEIEFEGESLPSKLTVKFPDLHIFFFISNVNLPYIISSLVTVNSPIPVSENQDDSIEKIEYDELSHSLKITHRTHVEGGEGIAIGKWQYKPDKGFYREKYDPFLSSDLIGSERIALTLSNSYECIEKFIPIHSEVQKCRYSLHFDREHYCIRKN